MKSPSLVGWETMVCTHVHYSNGTEVHQEELTFFLFVNYSCKDAHTNQVAQMPSLKCTPLIDQTLQAHLLDASQREELLRLQATTADSRELARELLKRDWLTAFQVNQLLQGKGNELVLGPFILLERIGEGGMGQVYKARQKLLNRVVALKVIRKECVNNPRVILRFQREIRAAGQLSHPHIVRAFDADQINGTYYIAMEFIDGVDLARLVRDTGPLRVDQACEYIRQAALGLQHASERGLVHRDIKPANLLVTRGVASDRRRSSGCIRLPNLKDRQSNATPKEAAHYPWGVVKILDMGLARCTDAFAGRASTHLTQIGSIMGTPEYIAPEQARDSHTSDVRADLYSLGCTLYFLLTGQPPFPDGTLTDKLMRHQTEEPAPVGIVRRQRMLARQGATEPSSVDKALLHVPRRVDSVIRKLLAKRPEDRFQTPNDLAIELQAILRKLADGSLLAEEAVETPAAVAFELPATSDSLPTTTVLLETNDEQRKPTRSQGWVARVAFLLAATGSVAFILLATVIAIVMSRSNPMQAGDVPRDPAPRSKEREEPSWKRALRHALAHHSSWDDARQELRRTRASAGSDDARKLDELLARLPTPFDLLERKKFEGAVPAGLPAEIVGVYGFAKGNFNKPVTTIAVSSNGRWIATNEDNGVRLFDLQSSLIPHKIWAHTGRVTRVAISPDSRLLATAGDDGFVKLWDHMCSTSTNAR
jgi:serine/threonine protein kinase